MEPDASHALPTTASSCAIRVVVRVRPLSQKEKSSGRGPVVEVTKNSVHVRQPSTCEDIDNDTNPPRTFVFDHCYGNALSTGNDDRVQVALFEEIGRDIVANAFDGFNCSVFAYGQTGSGKTYTMVGDKSENGKGLIPRICEALFDAIDKARAKDSCSDDQHKTIYSVHMNYCEIYKEKVKDLLDDSKAPLHRPGSQPLSAVDVECSSRPLKIREHPVHGPFVEGLITRPVGSYAEIEEELVAGQKLRTVAATLMNPTSSRSHAIFTIMFTQTRVDPITLSAHEKTSKICLVDLAGSERSDTSGTSGERLKEASMINKSLFTLGRVISSLGAKERIPYRDSTLTWLLKESLGGNAKTTMLAMVSPASENYDETLSTLRYAESAKKIVNRAVVNEDENAAIIRQLRQQIEDLKGQLMGTMRRRSSETSAGLVKSLLEREEMLGQLQRDAKRQEKCLQLPIAHPSLINLEEDLLENEPLAYALEPGLTVLGADPTVVLGESAVTGSPRSLHRDSFLEGVVLNEAANPSVHLIHLTHDAASLLPVHIKILNDNGFITLEPSPSALVLVNGAPIENFTPLKHRDRIQLGASHAFRVFVPSEALSRRHTAKTDTQIEEANALCIQADIPYRFQREATSDVSILSVDGKTAGITWERPLFLERLQTLRAYNADLIEKETLISMLGLPAVCAPPTGEVDDPVEKEAEGNTQEVENTCHEETPPTADPAQKTNQSPHLTVEIPPLATCFKNDPGDPFFQIRSNTMRSMGQARLYVALDLSSVVPTSCPTIDRVITVFDPVGLHMASITLELVTEIYKAVPKSPDLVQHTIKVSWKELRFHTVQSPEGVYISYYGWGVPRSNQGATPKATSSTGVFALAHRMSFNVHAPKRQPLIEVFRDQFLTLDVWGWGKVPASPPSVQSSPSSVLSYLSEPSSATPPSRRRQSKVDVFVSVDVEERMPDGLYAPVTVKEDGTLRLSQYTSRRLVVRVVQADQQPFCIGSIAHIRISPQQAIGHSKSVSQFEAASALGSATLGGFFKRFGAKESPRPSSEDWAAWITLPLRGPVQVDREARSVVSVMKWDGNARETVDMRGQRRVYRIALALETTLSCVPVVLSTKFTAKVLVKMKKETAWWAREQVSRMHRLGHWFSVDVGQDMTPPHEVVAEKLLDHYGKGMERLHAAFNLERYRQQVATEAALHGEEGLLRVNTSPGLEFVLSQVSGEWTIASATRQGAAVHVMSGVEMNQPATNAFKHHMTHTITYPSHLDPFAGELSGYLMLSMSASSLWNRRWFVLQRPLLYCYKTFAKRDIIGVLDISKCTVAIDKDALFPFSFRVTSLVEKAPITWQLQASSADEMIAWRNGIAPVALVEDRKSKS
ncbi:hypothetical protein H310_05046 [Aphanomyces invadans]|uniref:Kinesin-like protein n=1 Tax=Aphanomyces invadans TaxID=157072 RepID=A0A024UBJ4_9STRA|nr:hypothetical protein H310_05046 [Aphanomyces invadans]ETW03649.1 hypothetical protein H310_05046 [Aphanomyces invadans]|eukprot:XP_008867878.1 hypothetical protein H310_05046 [Aphanomyces invadans]